MSQRGPKELSAKALGISTQTEWRADYELTGELLTVRFLFAQGRIENPFGIRVRLTSLARDLGAKRLRIELIAANARLLRAIRERYGFETTQSGEYLEFDL